jgi:hypothetical protein
MGTSHDIAWISKLPGGLGYRLETTLYTITLHIYVSFIFLNVITRFGCPRSLTNEQRTHFLSKNIGTLTR